VHHIVRDVPHRARRAEEVLDRVRLLVARAAGTAARAVAGCDVLPRRMAVLLRRMTVIRRAMNGTSWAHARLKVEGVDE
jgi:hypothetical protein